MWFSFFGGVYFLPGFMQPYSYTFSEVEVLENHWLTFNIAVHINFTEVGFHLLPTQHTCMRRSDLLYKNLPLAVILKCAATRVLTGSIDGHPQISLLNEHNLFHDF